jgi:replicative DNA helicase
MPGGDGGRIDLDRTPPQDVAAEQSVLGGMLLSKDAIADVVEVLRSGDFYRPAHQTIFDAVIDLYGRGEPADPVTIAAELTREGTLTKVGGAPYLHTLIASVPTAANAGYYAEIVRERAILRRLVDAGTRIVQLGYGTAAGMGGDVDDVVDRAQQAVYDVTERRTSDDYVRLEEVLQQAFDEIEAMGSRGSELYGVPTGFHELDELTNGLHPGQLIVVAGRPAQGKALALETPLATPTGWTTMGAVQVGDQLLGADGKPTTVVDATDVMPDRSCYEVEFDDGTVLVADGSHQWLTDTRASRRSAKHARVPGIFAAVRTTEEIAATLVCSTADQRLNHSIRNAQPLDLPARDDLLIPPYVLGVWLGDGHSASARFTTADPEIVMYLEGEGMRVAPQARKLVYSIRLPALPGPERRACVVCGQNFVPKTTQVRTCGRTCGGKARDTRRIAAPKCLKCGLPAITGYGYCQPCQRSHGSVAALLRTLGVLNNKHIPAPYLRASEGQRRALLAGLLDTDGTVTATGSVEYSTTSPRLATEVTELVVGLGYRCGVRRKRVAGRTEASSVAYTVTFTTTDEVFRLERKRLTLKQRYRSTPQRLGARFIKSVRPVPSVPVRCVQVDNSDHLYLAGRSMVPTHNSTLGLDILRAASIQHGMTSVLFSLEMGRSEITMRLLSAEARILLSHLRTGQMTDDDWNRLARKMGEVAEAPMFIDDSPNMSMMEIRAKARRLKQRHDLKVVVVDYLQLMTSPKRVENRQQEVAEMSRSLKLLAKELEVPVIAISQLNRGAEQRADKRPQMSDLRESGAIEQDADMVILLHREDFYEKESPRAGEADLIVAKHRNGPTKDIVVLSQLHYSRFVDMQRT